VLDDAERARRVAAGQSFAIRLDVAACLAIVGELRFEETGRGRIAVDPAALGDVVLGRKDLGVAYHLAVVLDDDAQGVTTVTRGEDLFPATHLHRLLQAVLGLATPRYHHHALVRDASGRRLAKRDRDLALAELRSRGVTPAEIRARLGA
jgi:glutamyl-Q tRNA(Asp) synthetase